MRGKLKLLSIVVAGLLVGCGQVQDTETETVVTPVWHETIDVDGRVEATENEELYLAFPAKIKAIHIKDGEVVNKGQALFTLDTTDYEEVISEKKGEIALLQAELDALKNPENTLVADLQYVQEQIKVKEDYKNNETDPEIKQLKNNITLLNEELIRLKSDYETSKKLSEVGGVSEKSLQEIKDMISAKEKEIENVENSIVAYKTNINLELSQLESKAQSLNLQMSETDRTNAANMKVLQVKLDNANAQLSNLKQKYDTVTLKEGQLLAQKNQLLVYDIKCVVGSPVAANTQLLARCANLESIIVKIDIPIEDLLSVQVGNQVVINAYNEQTQEIIGRISRLSNHAIDKDGDSYIEAEVEITEGKELLQVNAQLDGTIYLSE